MEPDNPWKWNVKELARYEELSYVSFPGNHFSVSKEGKWRK